MKKLAPWIVIAERFGRDKIHFQIIDDNKEDRLGSRQVPGYPYGWPSIDICYFESNGKYIEEITSAAYRHYRYMRDDAFPLVYRPIGNKWYPAPNRALLFLYRTYAYDDGCLSTGYSHIMEVHKKEFSLPCRELEHKYAIVERCFL